MLAISGAPIAPALAMLLCMCLRGPSVKADEDPHAMLSETFAEGETALERWEFTATGPARLAMESRTGEDGGEGHGVYVDFRERASWRFMSRETFGLEGGAQYTLSARVRCNLGYGSFNLVAETPDPPPVTLATAPIIKRANESHVLKAVFRAPGEGATVRVGIVASGYSEIRIEEVHLRRNVPPLSTYITGLLLPSPPLSRARFRTGAFLEAEDIVVAGQPFTHDDRDGDGLWALCRVDPGDNPWLFSENTVVKSDSRSEEEGGTLPPLVLTAKGLTPGPYQVFLSDPMRDAAVSLNGETWRQAKGGEGEIELGLLDVTDSLSVWVAHRVGTEANPGPIYVDYLRLMPVYDAKRGLEQPSPPAPAPARPSVTETTLRLWNPSGIPRGEQWVTAGLPFAQGAFRPGDGIEVGGASELSSRALVLWPDGSAKWLRVELRTSVPGESEAILPVRYGPGVPATTPARRPLEETEGGYVLRSGSLEVHVRDGVWNRLVLGGREIISEPPSVQMSTETGLRLSKLLVEGVRAEHEGPRPCLTVSGHLAADDGTPGPARFTALLSERAPEALAVAFGVVNESDERYRPEAGCSRAVPLTDLTLVIGGVQIAPDSVVWPSGAVPLAGEEQTLLQAGSGSCVEDFVGRWRLTEGEAVVAQGERTEGWVDLRGNGAGLAIGVREFLEKQPSALSVRRTETGTEVCIGLWPRQAGGVLRYAQGTQLVAEFALLAHDGHLSAGERASRLAAVTHPVRAALPAEHHCATGIFGPLTTRREERFEGYYRSAEATFEDLCVRRRAYGTEDWGDFFGANGYVRGTGKLWTNMEWEFIAYLVQRFSSTGDFRYLEVADEAARHFASIDVVHCSSNPLWRGGSYVHTGDLREGHQVDPPDFAHAGWTQGLLWVYYMCGDELLPPAAVGIADYVVRNMPPQGPYGSQPAFSMWNCSRQAANPILTLVSVYELTHDPEHLAALHRLVDFALRVQDPKLGCWATPFYEEPVHHRPSPDYAGLLFRSLYTYWQLAGDERVPRAFRRLEGFLLQRHPEDTRRYLCPQSYYRRGLTNTGVPCAMAALFSQDPGPVLELGLAELLREFPSGTERTALEVRGVPGVFSSAELVLGARDATVARSAQ